MGIQPDYIVGRAKDELDQKRKEKVAYYCNLDKNDVISNPDCETIYQIPLVFKKQNFDKKVLEKLDLPSKQPQLKKWKQLVDKVLAKKKKTVTIAIIAKYISTGNYELKDSYHSLIESIDHSSWHHDVEPVLEFIKAEDLEKNNSKALKKLKAADGIVVPIGWGERGVEGKIKAIKYARESKTPYLGLCYGMQLACVEYARNIVGLKKANTSEVNPDSPHLIIHEIPFDEKYQQIKGDGASMRLGAFDCILKPGSLADKIYTKHKAFKDSKKKLISERHRHRFEFNNAYREQLEKNGFVISGTSPDDFFVEMIELPKKDHPFFFATQAHPEYKSKPLDPHPIFIEYLAAVIKEQK
jgi:CTP synthase